MKRLLCIVGAMNAGGAETFLMKLYRAIDKTKYQMDFCVNVSENFYAKEIEALGGKIHIIPSKSESFVKFKKALTALIKENGYKSVLRVSSNGMGFMDIKIAKKAGAEVLAVRSSNSSDGDGLKTAIAHKLGRFLYGKYVNVKIAPSDLAAKYTFGEKAYQNGEVHILHNAIDLSFFCYTQDGRAEIRKEFSISEKDVLFGHIGRLNQQKNHSFLLDVFKDILSKTPNAKLMLVGKGELEEEIKEKAKALGIDERILFTGVRTDIPKLLSAMDCFVFPSFYEGMPNTIIEAQSTGLPCIIADTITREANITDLVEYLPLDAGSQMWAKKCIEASEKPRVIDIKEAFLENRYDIETIVSDFESLLFESQN